MAQMKHVAPVVALVAALFPAVSPVSAQVNVLNNQQVVVPPNVSQTLGQSGQQAPPQGPITGTICIEQITATFCNVPVAPNTNGYGTAAGTASGTASSAGSAAAGGSAASGASRNASSLPPCMREPVASELCN